MSSPSSLSTPRDPILRDENALVLLSMIERAGLAAEIELQAMCEVEQALLQRLLFGLHMGRFIEHRTNYVRLTELGRECLDRMALYEEILEDLLGSLNVQGQERRTWGRLLRAYRKSSFRLYQNSVCTVLQWQRLASVLMLDGEQRSWFNAIVVKSMWVRDLRNWRRHVPPEEIDASFEKPLSEPEGAVHRILWQILLDKPNPERVTPSTVTATPSGSRRNIDVLVAWVRAFHRFQAHCGPDVWFDLWLDQSGQLLEQLKDSPRIEDPSAFESFHTGDACRHTLGEAHPFAGFNETWQPGASGRHTNHMRPQPSIPTVSPSIEGEPPLTGTAREKSSWQAALWCVRLKSAPSVVERWQFARWLTRSPRHLREFMSIRRQDRGLAHRRPANVSRANVTHVNWWKGSLPKPAPVRVASRVLAWSAPAAIVTSALLTIVPASRMDIGAPDDAIAIAVDRSSTRELDDGTRVSLDAGSTLRVEFTNKSRRVHLLEGKAVFEVADDARRPFVVNAFFVDIAAPVSKFAVEIDSGVYVIVYEGSIHVSPRGEGGAGKKGIVLRGGETLRIPMTGLNELVAARREKSSVPLIGG